MSRLIVGVVESVCFNSKPDVHTVSYDKAGKAIADRNTEYWKANIGAVSGEWKYVHNTLKMGVESFLTLSKLNPKDFDFRVRYVDISEAGHFYPFFNGCGDTVYFK